MALRDVAATVGIRWRLSYVVLLAWTICATTPSAERMGYAPEEFVARRQRLATIVLMGVAGSARPV